MIPRPAAADPSAFSTCCRICSAACLLRGSVIPTAPKYNMSTHHITASDSCDDIYHYDAQKLFTLQAHFSKRPNSNLSMHRQSGTQDNDLDSKNSRNNPVARCKGQPELLKTEGL